MQDTISIQITNRFFKALEEIIAKKEIRGIQTFCKLYEIDKRNLYKVKKEPDKFYLKPSWLHYLVKDFSVSATWLITGSGKIFTK
ncbi:hypothetical protein [Capnocytophaga catalasegens]|uniref:Phage repressor protein n=1 Tax=Capnocytophaga catalasegens TaxID=1004260 RepID=A0AAV5AXE8_9FLAO|nr:hypothetical protein [Capnocytophaga catalasegens]GIZ15099.1 hypothetical protein RCZ03_10990 [Capnocytophaga catalasegens]GJM50016.1 hypothetical protein RCZ15_09910 [Capnocytophaga catalasegens]GJM53887.1 hypothetical protein RCZ16_22030 [Capnocytophaga catalasegens]